MPPTLPGEYGFAPQREPGTVEEWKECLQNGSPGSPWTFKGNIDNAARLMAAFSQGRRYVLDTMSAKGIRAEVPPTQIWLAEGGKSAWANYDSGTGRVAIRIQVEFLEHFSQFDPDELRAIKRVDGVTVFYGPLEDYFSSVAVEEAHHCVYRQIFKPFPHQAIDPLSMALPEYDADDAEWHALRWQNMFARQQGLHKESQKSLKKRLQAAKALRRFQRGRR